MVYRDIQRFTGNIPEGYPDTAQGVGTCADSDVDTLSIASNTPAGHAPQVTKSKDKKPPISKKISGVFVLKGGALQSA
jgi:hypothetical protein